MDCPICHKPQHFSNETPAPFNCRCPQVPTTTSDAANMNTPDEPLAHELAEKFLRWPLPHSVCADRCATSQGPGRIGTNLLSYIEARQMMQEVVIQTLHEHGLLPPSF